MYVIKEPKELSFEKVGIKGKIFSTFDLSDKTQFVLIETVHGHETEIIEHGCDFSYYVLEGEGSFMIDGVREKCVQGDLVMVPAGKRFTYKGTFKMLLNVTPPWRDEQEETVQTNDIL